KHEEGFAVLERQSRSEGGSRPFAGLEHVVRIVFRVEHEALHTLAQAHTGAPGDHGRNPTAARGHRHRPALVVRGFHARRAETESAVELGLRARRGHPAVPALQVRAEGILATLEWIRIARTDVRVVALRSDQLRALTRIVLRE